MQNIHKIAEGHGINKSVSVAEMVLNNFENARTTKPSKRFSRKGFTSQLGLTQSKTDRSSDVIRK